MSEAETHYRDMAIRTTRWAKVTLILVAIATAATVIRIAQLKLDPPPQLASANGAREAVTLEPRYRGAVFDRVGRTLAIDSPAWRLAIDPRFFAEHGYKHLETNDSTIDLTFDSMPASMSGPLDLAREHLRAIRFHELGRQLDPMIAMSASEITQKLLQTDPTRQYIVVQRLLEEWQVDALRSFIKDRRLGVRLEQRTVRRYFGPQSLSMVIGKVRDNGRGGSGLEQQREKQLQPTQGVLLTKRTSRGTVISVPRGSYERGTHGNDFGVTVDAHIQLLVEERLREQLNEFNAGGGRCVVIEPNSGDILAMVDILRPCPEKEEVILDDPIRRHEPSLARNRNLVDAFEPGSTFKPFIWAGAVDAGVGSTRSLPRNAKGQIKVNLGPISIPGRRVTVKDAGNSPYKGPLESIEIILIRSLNTGMTEMVRPLSDEEARSIVKRFGFGERTTCGLAGSAEHPGQVTSLKNWSFANTSVSVSFGHEVSVTTLQMARAFSAFCTGGLMPQLRIIRPLHVQDAAAATSRLLTTRALTPDIANRTKNALGRVVTEGTLRNHGRSVRYSMLGKSGTADLPNPKGGYFKDRHTSNVIAAAPFDNPRVVVYCVIDDPDKSIGHYGGVVAGPVVRDVVDMTLEYLGVEPDIDEVANPKQLVADPSTTLTVGE